MPHVSPTAVAPLERASVSRARERNEAMADPFRDDLLIERVSGRLSPRVLFLCGINDCFPRESLFEGWEDTDKLSMMDVPGCDPEHFSAPDFFPRLSNMYM